MMKNISNKDKRKISKNFKIIKFKLLVNIIDVLICTMYFKHNPTLVTSHPYFKLQRFKLQMRSNTIAGSATPNIWGGL